MQTNDMLSGHFHRQIAELLLNEHVKKGKALGSPPFNWFTVMKLKLV